MRKWIVERIRLATPLMELIGDGDAAEGQDKVLSAGAAGMSGRPETQPPFIVARALPTGPLVSGDRNIDSVPYLVWVHDEQGSFEAVINPALQMLRDALSVPTPVRRLDGEVIMESRWDGESADLFDQTFSTATRYGQWTFVVSRP